MDWWKLIYLLFIVVIGYLPYKMIGLLRNYGLTSISTRLSFLMAVLFLLLSMLLVFQISKLPINSSLFPVFSFGMTLLIWAAAPWLLRRFGTRPTEAIIEKPKWFIIRAEFKTLILKLCEVLFQQMKFAYLLFAVLGGLSFESRIWWFTGIVSVLHLFNIIFVPSGWLFFLISIPMGILFSWLILNGYIFVTMTIHLWFYLILIGWYWLNRKHITMFRNMVTQKQS